MVLIELTLFIIRNPLKMIIKVVLSEMPSSQHCIPFSRRK